MSDDKVKQIENLIAEFSVRYLDEEFTDLNIKLLEKLAERDDISLNRGKVENWACGIVYAIGQLNFLFNRSFDPYVHQDDVCYYFGVSKQATWLKARDIRRALKLKINDDEFSTKFVLSLNIPDSDDDLKRIRTFEEIKAKFRQNFPNDVDDVKNIKLLNFINNLPNVDEKERLDIIISLLRSAFLIRGPNSMVISSGDGDKFKIPLFTNVKKYESFVGDCEKYPPSTFAFYNVCYYMSNDDLEGIILNLDSENFFISKEMIDKIYPNHEKVNYFNIFF